MGLNLPTRGSKCNSSNSLLVKKKNLVHCKIKSLWNIGEMNSKVYFLELQNYPMKWKAGIVLCCVVVVRVPTCCYKSAKCNPYLFQYCVPVDIASTVLVVVVSVSIYLIDCGLVVDVMVAWPFHLVLHNVSQTGAILLCSTFHF